MNNRRQLALGTFFIVVLGLLAYATLFLTDFRLFGETYAMAVNFTEANGLRKGDSVLVAGIRQGHVVSLAYDPTAVIERRVTVELSLDEEIGLREGFTIRIEDATLLGGRQITIDPGPPEAAEIPGDATLFGSVAGNALASLSKLIDENGDQLSTFVDNVTAFSTDLREGRGVLGRLTSDQALGDQVQSAIGRFEVFSDNAAELTTGLREGKGTIGRLLTDEDLANKMAEIGDRLAAITTDVAAFTKDLPEGKGILPKLVNDEVLAKDITDAFARVREIVDKINSGEGNLGRLVYDEAAMEHLTSIASKMDSGEGTLGALINKSEVYDKLSAIVDDLAGVSGSLKAGRGTVGKLLNDDQLYVDLQRAVDLVIKSLEEYREAAPISTFTAVLFGAF